MKPSTVKIIATERVRQRFNKELIQHFVDRSLHKMGQCPEHVGVWVSQYRTVYGEVTVVYAKDVQTAKVAYRDEVPQEILEGGEFRSDFKLTKEESKKQIQAMWRATGGDFHAPLPRPDHRDVAGLSFVTKDNDLVSAKELEKLANDPFFKDLGRWYSDLDSCSERFKVAAIAYYADDEDYYYAPICATTDDISAFGPMCGTLFGKAYGKFVTNIPQVKPTVLFFSLWVTDDDLEYVRSQFYFCITKAMAILAGEDTHFQTHNGIPFFHAVTPSLTEGEKFELSKGFDIEGQ